LLNFMFDKMFFNMEHKDGNIPNTHEQGGDTESSHGNLP